MDERRSGTVLVLTGATVKQGMEGVEARAAEELEEALRSMPGFISMKDYTAEDGEELTVIRFRSEADVLRWRDEGLHGEYQRVVNEYYEAFWVQTAEVYREYIWRDGERTDDDLSWMFRGDGVV